MSTLPPPAPGSHPLLDTFEEGISRDVASAVMNHPFFNRGDAPATPAPAAVEPPVPPVEEAAGEQVGDLPTPDADDRTAPNSPVHPGEPDPSAPPAVEPEDPELVQMRALATWAKSLRPEVAEQFGYIERGAAVAVPTDEYAAYQAWRRGGSQSQQPAGHVPEWVADLDPEARTAFDALQAQNQQLLTQRDQAAREAQQAYIPQEQAELHRRADIFDGAMKQYAADHSFTDLQAQELMDSAIRAGVVPNILESQRTYSPSGQLINEADFAAVARQALDFGLLQRPDLRGQIGSVPAPVQQQAPAPAPVHDSTASKKILAGHLATAPSAATSPLGPTGPLNEQQQRSAIAEYLRSQGLAS